MRCLWMPVWAITIAPVLAADAPPREISFFDSANRFLDKDPWADKAPAKLVSSTTVIDSFEDWAKTKADWLFNPYHLKPESTPEHATDGQSALKVTFVHPGDRECVLGYREGTSGWGNPEYERKAALSARVLFNDEIRLDVFNPGDPVTLLVTVGQEGAQAGSAFKVPLTSGKNEVALTTAELIANLYRATTVLNTTMFGIADQGDKPVTLYFDNFRWVGPGIGENLIQHAKCLQFGSKSYCRPFFSHVDSTTPYTPERGYGWQTPSQVVFEYSRNMITETSTGRQPHDELLRGSVYQINSPFLVDLPNGRYRLHVVEGVSLGRYTLPAFRYDFTLVAGGTPVLVRAPSRAPRTSCAALTAWTRPITNQAKTSSASTWGRTSTRWSARWRSRVGNSSWSSKPIRSTKRK